MKLYKVKQILRKIKYKVSVICSFPHFWLCISILLFSIVSLLISHCVYKLGLDYTSSIFANIFAGLLTGLIICLLSGIKQAYISKLKNKKKWFEHIRSMIKEYNMLFKELTNKSFVAYNGDEDLFNFIYDIGSHANWVNEDIMQSMFDKSLSFNPYTFCKKHFNYDAVLLDSDFSELHNNLYEIDIVSPNKKEILHYFEKVNKHLKRLYSATYHQLQDINIKLEETDKFII